MYFPVRFLRERVRFTSNLQAGSPPPPCMLLRAGGCGAARGAALRPQIALLMSTAKVPTFNLDPFAMRQFDDPNYTGTRIDHDKTGFAAKINELYDSGDYPLVDGYAPFCKHIFVPNITPAQLNVLPITKENEHLLRSGYEARTEQELEVLVRWFPVDAVPRPPVAKYLDIILYSREQINKEVAAMPDKATAMGRDEHDDGGSPWGIISVKAQDVDYELPMQPITMMRNTLGKEEGGSGVPMDRERYTASVAFWSGHAPLK